MRSRRKKQSNPLPSSLPPPLREVAEPARPEGVTSDDSPRVFFKRISFFNDTPSADKADGFPKRGQASVYTHRSTTAVDISPHRDAGGENKKEENL